MSIPLNKSSFVSGEVSPSLFGHVDLVKFAAGASTERNMFVSYKGGGYSRAGTAFTGFSKQTGRAYPPRLIPFQFNLEQGLVLEFGHQYYRVISNGAYVTENVIPISTISIANPVVITANATGGSSATPNNGLVASSYNPGELVTLAGGVYVTPAVISVTTTELIALSLLSPGTGIFAPADTVHLSGGIFGSSAIITVSTTQVVGATVDAAGSGGTAGAQVVTGTSGTGTMFQANVTIGVGGGISSVDSISVAGSYTVNPSAPGAEPVTGASLIGAKLALVLGIHTFAITSQGSFTANPTLGFMGQASTSGSGLGATFQYALMAPLAVTFSSPGIYTTFPSNPVAQASSTGSGVGVTFTASPIAIAPYVAGDWVYISAVGGMTNLNGNTYVIGSGATTNTFPLQDVYGNNIDSTHWAAYTGGGTMGRIYTHSMPYDESDLPYLKFTQSADVMSLTCWNQKTFTEYQPIDIGRIADNNWTFAYTNFATTVTPPIAISGTTSASGTVDYQYVITSVNPTDGTESIASPIIEIYSAVDISATAGSNTLGWSPVSGINQYNIYKAEPGYSVVPPVGSLFGFAGSAYGTQFVDSNIVADFQQVPPTHQNPFARGQIIGATVVNGGDSYTTVTFTITTSTGSGAALIGVIVGGALVAIIVQDNGQNYADADTVAVSGDGSGATAILNIGALTGTYPGVVAYFQERRVYASTINNPDTYFMSQPGSYMNFDTRTPTIASDAITGTPWGVQVNGIQWMIQTAGGLLTMTGLSAWMLVGAGSFATNVQPISPSSQDAIRQAFTGVSPIIPPIDVNYDVIYVNSKGSLYYSLPYQLYALSEPLDLTEFSSQLFTGFTTVSHAWCEQPFKLLWSVRDDGSMLSLTFLKAQQVVGWARHDTHGQFVSNCSVSEPPVDALYVAVKRYIGANQPYVIERMDNRIWSDIEDSWCVDCALSLPQPEPQATLTVSSATGLGAISGVTSLVGGAGYSAGTTATVVDNNGQGQGTGAVAALTITAGVIAAISFAGNEGTKYSYPRLVINDPAGTGSGASAVLTLDNSATFTASASVFSVGNVGDVIRMGGGIATITAYVDSEHVVADITTPIVAICPNSGGYVTPQPPGSWTMTVPVSSVSGLVHLAGATVTGLADGNVIPPTVVPANGVVTLAVPATSIVIGMGFTAQLQSVYLEGGEPTMQGRRKKIAAVTARLEASRDIMAGSNQPDGSTQSPVQIAPAWSNLTALPNKGVAPYNSNTVPLYTGDVRVPLSGGFATPGQVAFQQSLPVPMNILSIAVEALVGDDPEAQAPQRQQGRR